jgi:hypothetical protein
LPHLHTLTRVRQFVNGRMTLVGSSIKSHVNRILSKLNLRDRAQAIVVAYEARLVEAGSSPTRRAT